MGAGVVRGPGAPLAPERDRRRVVLASRGWSRGARGEFRSECGPCAVRVKDAKCNPVPEIYNGPMAGGPRGCCRAAARAAGCSPQLLTSPGVAAVHRGAAGEGGITKDFGQNFVSS
jgi:hypothetical protein